MIWDGFTAGKFLAPDVDGVEYESLEEAERVLYDHAISEEWITI